MLKLLISIHKKRYFREMKHIQIALIIIMAMSSSCATIVGGKSYTSYIKVQENKGVSITYQGEQIGVDKATIEIPRKKANKVVFTLSKVGCPSQNFEFTNRVFRGWAFVGSLSLTGNVIPFLPNVLDFIVGAYWKPDVKDPSITKLDYDTFSYDLSYTCDTTIPSEENINSIESKLLELKELFDKGVITEEEYKTSRLKILGN